MSSSVEKIPSVIKILSKTSVPLTPTAIAKKINTDARVLIKILNVLEELQIIQVETFEAQDSIIRGIRLTDEYKEFILRQIK